MLIKIYIFLLISIIFRSNIYELMIISPPKLSSTNLNSEILQFNFYFKINFKIDNNIKDLKLKFFFPFTLNNNFEVNWNKINNTCIIPSNLNKTNSIFRSSSDGYFIHDILLKDFNYDGNENSFYIEMIITNSANLNVGTGYNNPIKGYVLSSFSTNSLVLAYNDNIFLLYGNNTTISSNVKIDLSNSYEDRNINFITRNFLVKMDTLVYKPISRILIKLNNYNFSDDAESSCSTENNENLGLYFIPNGEIQCVFENNNKKGLYIIFNKPLPINKNIRIRFRVKNPNLPSSSDLIFLAYEKNSPFLIWKKTISNIFRCSETVFTNTYPRLYIGPNLDTSKTSFPNLPLFSAMENTKAIIFNSILLEFKIEIDIPVINNGYIITIYINGNNWTVIPENFIYHNLDILNDKSKEKIEIQSGNLLIKNVSSFNSSKLYKIGFKIALNGNESLIFDGNSNVFCSIKIEDADTNSLIVRLKNPYNVNNNFKNLITQTVPSVLNMPTVVHSLISTSSNTDFVNINDNIDNYGLIKGENLNFFIKGSFLKFSSLSFTPLESYIEIITDKSIYINQEGVFDNTSNMCLVKNNLGVDQNTYSDCSYYKLNKGLVGQEFSRFRIRSLNNNFWGSNTLDFIWGFKNVIVSKYSSLYFEDNDSAILDCYINIYQQTLTYNIDNNFNLGPHLRILQNLIVKQNNLFQSTVWEFINYYGSSTDNLFEVPILIRISGLFDNIDTFKTRRISLFFHDFEPLPEDFSLPYKIGCSSSIKNNISCFYYKGINSRTCGSNNCVNRFSHSRIDIIIPSENISVSDRKKIQILIPFTIPNGRSLPTYEFGLAPGISHNGELSKYTQLIGYKNLPNINRPTTYPSTKVSATLTSTLVNSNTAYKSGGVFFNGNPRIGSYNDITISIHCDFNRDNQCSIPIPPPDLNFSVTLCFPYNFMDNVSFDISNNYSDEEKKCVKNINYMHSNTNSKFCVWCPFFGSGNTGLSLIIYKMKFLSTNGLFWENGSFTSISGRTDTYGLFKLTDYSLITTKFFNNNFINNLKNDPLIIKYQTSTNSNFRSILFKINIKLNNSLPMGKFMIFSSTDTFKFNFAFNPNTHCLIIILTNNKELACTTTLRVTSTSNVFYLTTTEDLSPGSYVINLMGINGNFSNPPASLPVQFNLNIYTSIATNISDYANNNFIIDTIDTNFNFRVEEYLPLDLNTIKLTNFIFKNLDLNSITDLFLDIELSAGKYLNPADMILINLNNLAYNTSTSSKVRCIVTDLNNKLLSNLNDCNTINLSSIEITTDKITNYNKFRLILYGLKLTENSTNIEVKLVYRLNRNFTIMPPTFINIPTFKTVNNFSSIALAKNFSFSGLKPIYEFNIKLNLANINRNNKLYIKFPTDYNPYFDNYQLICKLKYKTQINNLFCYVASPYTIEIVGFSNIIKGDEFKITISGPRQPLTKGEVFYVSLMNSSDNDSLESSRLEYNTNSQLGIKELLVIENFKFSHYFIRSPNNLSFSLKVYSIILKGSIIEIVLDYLKWENERGLKINCSIKLNSVEFLENCIYDENKIKLTWKENLDINSVYDVFIQNTPSLDYEYCKTLLPEIYIIKSNNELTAYLSSFLLDLNELNFNRDINKIYIEFENVDINSHYELNREVKNKIKVREFNNDKFPDDLTLTINEDDSNSLFFTYIDTLKKNSTIGLYNFDFLYYGNDNTPNTIIPVSFKLSSKYYSENISLPPFLKVRWYNKKNDFIIDNIINIWRNKETLEINLSIKNEVTKLLRVNLKILNCSFLKVNPDLIFFFNNKVDSVIKISFINNITNINNNCKLEISSDNNMYFNKKTIDILMKDYPIKNNVNIQVGEVTSYSLNLNISSLSPIKLFYFFVYNKFYYKRYDYQIFKYIKEKRSFIYENHGSKIFNELNNINFKLIENELLADLDYKGIIYWYDINGEKGSFELNFRTKNINSNDGYIKIDFNNILNPEQIRKTVCTFGQILKYPLKNLQTSNGYKCTKELENNINNYSDLNPLFEKKNLTLENNSTNANITNNNTANNNSTNSTITQVNGINNRMLQINVIDIDNGNIINNNLNNNKKQSIIIYFLKNRSYFLDQNSYIKIQTYVIKNEFKIELQKRLFDLPNIIKIDPLISLQFLDQTIDNSYKFFKKNNKTIIVTEIKTKIPGYLYVGALDFIDSLEKRIKIKYILNGTDNYGHLLNYYRTFNITEKNQNFYFLVDGIKVPKYPLNRNISLFIIATDLQKNIYCKESQIITKDFLLTEIEVKKAINTYFKIINLCLI